MHEINGVNSRMIPHSDVRKETHDCTTSYDIDPNRMVFKVVEIKSRVNMEGGILIDVPNHVNMQELVFLTTQQKTGHFGENTYAYICSSI